MSTYKMPGIFTCVLNSRAVRIESGRLLVLLYVSVATGLVRDPNFKEIRPKESWHWMFSSGVYEDLVITHASATHIPHTCIHEHTY